MLKILGAVQGFKTYLTVAFTFLLLFGAWQKWWVVPNDAYIALMALALAFIRHGIGTAAADAVEDANARGARRDAQGTGTGPPSFAAVAMLFSGALAGLCILLLVAMASGCSKVTLSTVTPGGTNPVTGIVTGPVTNVTTVTVVNTNEVNLAAALLQGASAVVSSIIVKADPKAVPILQDMSMALQGVLTGTANSSAIGILQGYFGQNAAVDAYLPSLIGAAGSFEQGLLKKFGATIAGQIVLPEVKALSDGIAAGLATGQ